MFPDVGGASQVSITGTFSVSGIRQEMSVNNLIWYISLTTDWGVFIFGIDVPQGGQLKPPRFASPRAEAVSLSGI